MEDACPASIRMSKGYPNPTNPAAELGTAVHALGEMCIVIGINPHDMIGLTISNHVVNDKMADDASLYINVVNDLSHRYGVKPLVECRVVMSSLGRTDVYGTSDIVFIVVINRICHILDYKNGYNRVEVENNSQTAGYSVATLDTYDLWDKVDKVYNTIIQPNGDHISGPVRTVEYSIVDLIGWREKYRRSIALAEDPMTKPKAGEWCEYCPAQANCRARMERTLRLAYTDHPLEGISLGELEVIKEAIPDIKKWLDAVENRCLEEARNGHQFTNFKLVQSRPWPVVEDVEGFMKAAVAHGVDKSDLYNNPRLIGKSKAEKLLPKEIVNQYYKTQPATTKLAEMNDNRPAVRTGSAEGVFSNRTAESKSAVGVFKQRG
jgi:hypothetical protein